MENEDINEVFENKSIEQQKLQDSENTQEKTASIDKIDDKKQEDSKSVEVLINEVKTQYEDKIKTLISEKDKEIKERDSVIKQLLNEDNKIVEMTIADKINSKRNFKKW